MCAISVNAGHDQCQQLTTSCALDVMHHVDEQCRVWQACINTELKVVNDVDCQWRGYLSKSQMTTNIEAPHKQRQGSYLE